MLKSRKKKIKKNKNIFKILIDSSKIINFNIFSTFNNTIITLSDIKKNTIMWATSSSMGFKGSKRVSHHSSQLVAEKLGKSAINLGYKNTNIFLKGLGIGRDFAIKGIINSKINILSIHELTPIPHNGCKIKKRKKK